MSKRFMKLVAMYLVGWMAVIPTGFVLASSNGLSLRDTDALSEKKYSRLLEAKSLGAGEQGVAMQELSLDLPISLLLAENFNEKKKDQLLSASSNLSMDADKKIKAPNKDTLLCRVLWVGGGAIAGTLIAANSNRHIIMKLIDVPFGFALGGAVGGVIAIFVCQ